MPALRTPSSLAERFAAHAYDLLGSPFRLHGRDPGHGLDCVGVAVVALERAGCTSQIPNNYRLRGGNVEQFDRWAAEAGFVSVDEYHPVQDGDVLLACPDRDQFHLMISAKSCLIHAHASLGQVVAMPLPSPWPVIRKWRLAL